MTSQPNSLIEESARSLKTLESQINIAISRKGGEAYTRAHSGKVIVPTRKFHPLVYDCSFLQESTPEGTPYYKASFHMESSYGKDHLPQVRVRILYGTPQKVKKEREAIERTLQSEEFRGCLPTHFVPLFPESGQCQTDFTAEMIVYRPRVERVVVGPNPSDMEHQLQQRLDSLFTGTQLSPGTLVLFQEGDFLVCDLGSRLFKKRANRRFVVKLVLHVDDPGEDTRLHELIYGGHVLETLLMERAKLEKKDKELAAMILDYVTKLQRERFEEASRLLLTSNVARFIVPAAVDRYAFGSFCNEVTSTPEPKAYDARFNDVFIKIALFSHLGPLSDS